MDTPSAPLFTAFMQDLAKQIVPLVIEQIKQQTQAESMGMVALDPNNLSLPVYTLVQNDVAIRDQIRDMIDDAIDHRLTEVERSVEKLESKTDDMDSTVEGIDVDDIKGKLSTLEEKVGELEENSSVRIDADDNEFADAVMTVLRNNI